MYTYTEPTNHFDPPSPVSRATCYTRASRCNARARPGVTPARPGALLFSSIAGLAFVRE